MNSSPPPSFVLPAALLSQGYVLRPESEADIPFLLRLYASTREEELAPVLWTAEAKAAFLTQQFQAQRRHYRSYLNPCTFDLIEQRGEPIGRLYLETRHTTIHLVDISLLPTCRGHGIGAALLEGLQTVAHTSGRGVSTFVEKFNPALRLYRRLGFQEISDRGVYLEMEWRPNSPKPI